MVDLSDPQTQILFFIPLGAVALYLLSRGEPENADSAPVIAAVANGKEANFLRFNQDGVYGNLLAAEEHLRKVNGEKSQGFLSCAVKHLSLAGNHGSEAVSHTVAVGEPAQSQQYRQLTEKIVDLQHDIQDGKVSPTEGILRVREIKSDFESFNPSFDVSKCKACEI